VTTSPKPTGGNTIPPPPRLQGSPQADLFSMQQWVTQLYQQLVLGTNVQGTLADHEARIAALEQQVTAHETRIKALGG
jgi:hypothetical protein